MEEKIYTYKCGFCGAEYDEIHDRMNCEASCHKRLVEEMKAAEEAAKKAEHDSRKAEVDAAFETLHKLMTEYVNDYGIYEYAKSDEYSCFQWSSGASHRLW